MDKDQMEEFFRMVGFDPAAQGDSAEGSKDGSSEGRAQRNPGGGAGGRKRRRGKGAGKTSGGKGVGASWTPSSPRFPCRA